MSLNFLGEAAPRARWARGSAHPASGREGAEPGGARPPAVPSPGPLPCAVPAAVAAACGKLVAGDPSRSAAGLGWAVSQAQPPPLPVSRGLLAGGRAGGRRGGQDRAVGEPRGSSTGAGGMSARRAWGAPDPELRGVSRIGMLRNPRPGTRSVLQCWGVAELEP